MYGMVVVDDKEDIVLGIEKLGNWEQIGIQVAGTASNGVEALEILKRTRARILITDIRMPHMDGLELTKQAKELDSGIKIIILSGYDEFSYAQQAVKLGAQEYLLKPARIEVIREAVLRAREQLIHEEKKHYEMLRLKQKLRESIPFLRGEYFNSLISAPVKDLKKMEDKLKYLGVELDTNNFRVMVVSLDDYEAIHRTYTCEDFDLLMFAVINIIEETVSEYGSNVTFKSAKSEVCIVMNLHENLSDNIFTAAELCRDRIKEFLEQSVSVGIGRFYSDPQGICHSYREALKAVQNRFITGKGCIINIDDIDVGGDIRFRYPYELADELLQYLTVGAAARASEVYEQLVSELYNNNMSCPQLIKRYLVQYVSIISKKLMENGISMEDIIGSEIEYVTRLETYQTLEDVSVELNRLVNTVCDHIMNLKKQNEKNNIDIVARYINENYMKDISLNDISKLVYMSPSYISTLIKEHLGETFVERITRLRVEQAKVLLLSGDDKVYEVADKVGYNDRRYFSDIFKKYTGLTPKEYIDKYKN